MRVFNRIVMILLLGGLFVLGVYTVVYAFDLFGYRLEEALNVLNSFGSGLENFVRNVEAGNLPVLTTIILILVAVLGVILLVAELKPPAPRRVRMQKGTYITRDAVREEVDTSAGETLGVLGTSTRVKARRKPGARVYLDARVRRGEDTSAIQSGLRSSIQERLATRGVPVNKIKIKLTEVDPRHAESRVQ